MSNVRFIADLHLGHRNMAIKRGFKDESEHDEHIIKQWNNVVHKNDTTYILGDVTMEKATNYKILDRLVGHKIVVLGNHDMKNHVPKLLEHVNTVAGMIKYKSKIHRVSMFLTHCPIHPMELENRVGLNIHGHIHEHVVKKGLLFKNKDSRYICVSCEHVDYTPKLLDELINNITLSR